MQTFLDTWVQACREGVAKMGAIAPESLTEFLVFYSKIVNDMPEAMMQNETRIIAAAVTMIVKMLVRHEGYNPLGIQLTSDLAQDFHGAKAPETEDWLEVMRAHRIVYVDIPDGLYQYDFAFTSRAYTASMVGVLVEMTHLEPEWFKIVAFFKEPGPHTSESGCEFMLRTGRGFDFVVAERSEDVANMSRITHDLTDILKLTLLYHKSGEGLRKDLPRLSRERQRGLSGPKLKLAHQKASLFRMARYNAPANRFERKDQEPPVNGGWKLGVKSRVRGHFRWQAHGPKWSLRRLQYIPPHYRGAGDERVDLVRLEAP